MKRLLILTVLATTLSTASGWRSSSCSNISNRRSVSSSLAITASSRVSQVFRSVTVRRVSAKGVSGFSQPEVRLFYGFYV